MAVGLSSTVANAVLNALCRNTTWTQPTAVWVKLHTGSPGAAGTTGAAGNTTRQQATFGTAAASGTIANTAAIAWTSVSTSETYTFFSAWDASTAGNFLFSGTVTANPVTAGDNFTIAIGSCNCTVTSLAA